MARKDPVAEMRRAHRRFDDSDRPAAGRFDRLLTGLVFAVAVAAFFGSLTAHHSYDAVAGGVLLYQWIANGAAQQLFHPYHILYLPLGAALDALLDAAGLGTDPLTLLQSINALFAAGALALYYRLSRKLGLAPALALSLTLLLGAAHSYWYYATNAESYAPSLFFLILAFLSALELRPAEPFGRILRPGIWLGLAAGFHVTCVLALPALLFAAWPGANCEKPLRRPLVVLVAVCVVALAPYAAVYLHFEHTDPISGLTGELKASVDPGYRGKVWWSVDPENVWLEWRSLGAAAAPVELPGARSFLGRGAAAIGFGLLALTLLPVALVLPGRDRVRRLWMLLAWFLPVFAFFSTYNTASDKFASYQWVPLLLLIGVALRSMERAGRFYRPALALLLLLAVATAASSFGLTRARSDPATNPYLARARAIAAHTGPDDVVIHLGRGENQYQKVYVPYFAVRRSMVLDSYFDKTKRSAATTLRLIDERIREHMRLSRHVVVLADAAEPTPSRREFEKLHELDPESLQRLFAEFGAHVTAEDPDLGRLWSLDAPATVPASR